MCKDGLKGLIPDIYKYFFYLHMPRPALQDALCRISYQAHVLRAHSNPNVLRQQGPLSAGVWRYAWPLYTRCTYPVTHVAMRNVGRSQRFVRIVQTDRGV
jgi:hypothetical protein